MHQLFDYIDCLLFIATDSSLGIDSKSAEGAHLLRNMLEQTIYRPLGLHANEFDRRQSTYDLYALGIAVGALIWW